MLPAHHRMRRSQDFRETVRGGRRGGTPLLVVHLSPPPDHHALAGGGAPAPPATAGLVVSKAVGGAVVRTSVKRRLRHLLAERVPGLPAGSRVVVRASPATAVASSADLGAELDRALRSAARPRPRTGARVPR